MKGSPKDKQLGSNEAEFPGQGVGDCGLRNERRGGGGGGRGKQIILAFLGQTLVPDGVDFARQIGL